MKNKQNKFLALLLSLVAFSGVAATTSTYAYWNLLTKTEDAIVEVGEGLETIVAVNATAPAGKYLVPTGTITDMAVQVDEIELTYDVSLSKTVSTALALSVTESNVLIGGSATYAHMHL